VDSASPLPILLTAFEPFGGSTMNASLETARNVSAMVPGVEVLELPVVSGLAETSVFDRLADPRASQPSAMISLGEAGPEPVVRLEWVYVNFDDFRIPDNAGLVRKASRIEATGPAAYFAGIDLPGIVEEIGGRCPLPVVLSLSAGAFLCNHLAYAVSHRNPAIPYAFVHVPAWRPEESGFLLRDLVGTVAEILAAIRMRLSDDTLLR